MINECGSVVFSVSQLDVVCSVFSLCLGLFCCALFYCFIYGPFRVQNQCDIRAIRIKKTPIPIGFIVAVVDS